MTTATVGIRIARFCQWRYKSAVMMTSFLIAVSIWGADPEIVFARDGAPGQNVVSALQIPTLCSDASLMSVLGDSPKGVVRGQSNPGYSSLSGTDTELPPYDGDGLAPYGQDRWADFCEHPVVHEFIEAMNPFAEAEVHTLPNYYDPFGVQMGTSSNGPQGYRLGWVSYNDFVEMPAAHARGTSGSMQISEWNSYLKYSRLLQPGMLFNGTGYFDAEWWSGPSGVAMPAEVMLISTDLELGLFNEGPWSGQFAFHPQLVETYDAKLDRNAFNFDGRAIVTYKASPEWSFVGGLAIWDRVDTLIVPHVGVIWTPNDRWEFRILFPKTRISYFLGRRGNADFWIYGQAEYVAEAWQSVDPESPSIHRMQITDNRFTMGLRWDSTRYSVFTEAGYVCNREVKFAGANPGFDLDGSLLIHAGFRY